MDYLDKINKNISDSASDFLNIVWPSFSLTPRIGGGTVRAVESDTETGFAKELDMRAGIDAWQLLGNDRGIRGIASRVQWGCDYKNFTIRYKYSNGQESEYFKRLYAIENSDDGILFPHLTIQAFVSERSGDLLSAAAITTKDLILQVKKLFEWNVISDSGDSRYGLRVGADGTSFVYVSWQYILHSNIASSLIIPALSEC